jgi:penicillin-binding protein 1C
MRDLGSLSEAEYSSSIQHPIRVIPKSFPIEAPHFVDLLLARGAKESGSPLQTTIDLDLQRSLEKILLSHRERLKNFGARQAAALIVDNRNLEVLAMVGCRDGPRLGPNGCGSVAGTT